MQTSTMDINKQLKPLLKDIVAKKITINENEASENVKIMEEMVDVLITAMKEEDPLFKELFQKKVYTGSYYDGVRITQPNEFDLNMVLRLPMTKNDILIEPTKDAPAFYHYKLKESIKELYALHPKWTPLLYHKLVKFFDEDNQLLRREIQRWIQSIISRVVAKKEFRLPPSVKKLERSLSGPAFTWYITTEKGHKIDVDLMPVIDCSHYPMPNGIAQRRRFIEFSQPQTKVLFLVPKPAKGGDACFNTAPTYWRIFFPEAEKELLKRLNSVKMLIKLFKLLRDKHKWASIASYYIKTLFLLEVEEHPSPDYWKEEKLGTLFMEMLEKFKNVIFERFLPNYFAPEDNLLSRLSGAEAYNIANRLALIIKDINKDPSKIADYF